MKADNKKAKTMFKFLRDKLRSGLSKLTKAIEQEGVEEEIEVARHEEQPAEENATERQGINEKKEQAEPAQEKAPKKDRVPFFRNPFAKKHEDIDTAGFEEVTVTQEPQKLDNDKKAPEKRKPLIAEKAAGQALSEKEEIDAAAVPQERAALEKEITSLEKQEEVKAQEEPDALVNKGLISSLKEMVLTKRISAQQFDDLFWDLEAILLESSVAVEVIDTVKARLREDLVEKPIPRNRIMQTIEESLMKSLDHIVRESSIDFVSMVRKKKPYVICFVGINGSGKTTTIAKVAHLLQGKGLSVVLAAADTFRAAAIDQLQEHADRLKAKLIRHEYGSDPAAVAFDAIKHAKAKKADVVLIDTAGRMHSNTNLIDEMKKIVRVAQPDLKVFVGESITGNDCVEQAKSFHAAVGINALILAKADVDEKGGAAVSVSHITGAPILFLGTGQGYDDLKEFSKKDLMENLGLTGP